MAQSALKTCEICMGGSATDFCLICEQYFCMSCKLLHKRQKVTKNHEFQSAQNVVPEVKLRCNEHKEDFLFLCDNCNISVCAQCVTGKHYGHKVSSMKEYISSLRTPFREEMRTKLDVIKTNQKQVETGLTTFDLSVTSVINEVKEEGTQIKAMVDRHIEKMIATLREKTRHEKESLTKTLVDYKQQLEKAKEIEKREHKTQQSRDDASTIQHLKTLNDELSKLSVVPLPAFLPSIKYSPKKVTDSDIDQLIGTYSLRTTQTKKADRAPAGYKMYQKEYNKVTKENTAYEQRLEKLRKEYDRLEAKVKKLVEMNTGLQDENERYKMYVNEYNKLTEENTAHQQSIKAYDIYICKLEDENTDLKQRCKVLEKQTKSLKDENTDLQERLKSQGKGTKETERSEQRLQRPQMAPHAGGRQYKEFQNQIATLTAEKESLMQRLSMVAGIKMRANNPGIADLSDPNRPQKLAEQFREVYDNAWTNLLDYITDNTDTTDDIVVQQIVAVTQKIFEQCQTEGGKMKHGLLRIIGYPEDTFEKQYTGHDPIVKMMKDLVQISAECIHERVLQKIKEIREIKRILQDGGKSADVFLTKCSKLCLFMCVKDPPVVLDFNFKRGDLFDKDKLYAFTTSGEIIDYLVWPVVYLNENGPIISKGVAQGRKK